MNANFLVNGKRQDGKKSDGTSSLTDLGFRLGKVRLMNKTGFQGFQVVGGRLKLRKRDRQNIWANTFRACLFWVKVEGKIEEGQKLVGLTFFPWFGTTLERVRKGNDGWVPHQKCFCPVENGKYGESTFLSKIT